MKFIAPIVSAWRNRSLRERGLLSSLAVLIAVLAIAYGVVLPLRRAAEEATIERDAAARNLAEVELALRLNAEGRSVAPLPEGGLAEAIELSAIVSGIAIERIRSGNAGEVTVIAGSLEPAAFFSWLRTLDKAHGVYPANMTATRNRDGFLNVELRFAGADL